MSITGKIESCLPSFTKTEAKIARFILDHREDGVEQYLLGDLSRELGVGEATIVRFCRKLGLGGFTELKFLLSAENEEHASDRDESSEIKDILTSSIKMTDSMVSLKDVSDVVDLIGEASEVFFFGIGMSGLSASMGESRLFRFGKRTKAITEAHAQSMQASLCDENSLVVAVSISGETIDLIEAVVLAKESGSKVVVITSYLRSTLAELADYVLLSYGKPNYINAGAFSTVVSQLYILDLITSEYAARFRVEAARSKKRIARSIISKMAN